MSVLITQPDEMTPTRLTQILRDQGVLPEGKVAAIEYVHVDRDNFADEYILRPRYEETAVEKTAVFPLPKNLLLRISFPGKGWPNEPRFVNDIIPIMAERWPKRPLPFVTYYEAVYDVNTKSSHLLREDLSQTHFKADSEAPTTCCEQVMDGWALLHATWWEHPQLASLVGALATNELMAGYLQEAQQNLPRLLETMAAHLSPAQKTVLQLVPTKWPERRYVRNLAGQGVTLAHHTASPAVVLFPHDPAAHQIKLTTWEPWRVGNGTLDTAYYMAFWWPQAARSELEMPMLHHYYQRLVAYGVDGYSWDDCLYDYRASIIRLLLQLIQSWKPIYQNNWYWQAMMRGLIAFADWDCAELLKGKHAYD